MSKIALRMYIGFILLICVLPVVLAPVFSEQPNYEKRALAEAPKLVEDGALNQNFPGDFETYLSDHFAGRPQLSSLNGAIYYYGLGESSSSQIVAGKDGWLFYESTMDDYLGKNILSQRGVERLYRILSLTNEYVESTGSKFFFTVAPNKNTLYGEFMSDRYIKVSEDSNLSMLSVRLQSGDVPYVDLVSAFQNADQGTQYYHKRDSHWNNTGAVYAYNEIMKAVGAKVDVAYDDYANTSYEIRKDWFGDLDNMLIPAFEIKDEQAYYDITNDYSSKKPIQNPEALEISTYKNEEGKSILMFRDSFANTLYPLISNQFSKADYLRAVPYRFDRAENGYDVVLWEIVERNLPEILNKAPVFEAPEREITSDIEEVDSEFCKTYQEEQGDLVHLYGYVNPELITLDDARIYIRIGNGQTSVIFEASPVLEDSIAEEALAISPQMAESGFSLYISSSKFTSGEYSVDVIVDGDSYSSVTAIGNVKFE